MNIFDPNDTDFNSYDHSEPSEEQAAANEAASTPATEIVKAARKAKKPAKKAPAKKAGVTPKTAKKTAKKAAKKAAKAAKAPKARVAKKQAAGHTKKGAPYVKYDSGKRRGPGAGGKLVRKGDAAYGARLVKVRAAKALTQTQAAKKLGIGQPSLSNIEKGTVMASADLQAKIEKTFGVKALKVAKAPKTAKKGAKK